MTLQNRYVILRKLGQGGMGAVYQAQDLRFQGRLWAVKELSPATLHDAAERQNAILAFHHEFQLLAGLDHPNLPKVVDLFEEGGNQFIVMEYVDGQTLQQVLDTSGGLSEAVVLGWADQLCDVLDYLHARKPPIVFRDLKPSNIMLTHDGRIKLIDFGIARFFKPGKSKDTAQFGTVGFAAPEQFGTGQTDARSDVYALGVTLHTLLTRYDPASTPFILPPARSINPQVSEQTAAVIERATRSAPLDRYQSTGEMKNALHYRAQAQPLLACQKCGRADETLRATVFLYVVSIVVMTSKRGWSGVMCRRCRIKYGVLFSIVSLLFGPWGIPWGVIYTLQALVTNLAGGTQPKENNAPILAYQGARYLERGDAVRAYACLTSSLAFENSPSVEAALNQVKPLVLQQVPSARVQVPGQSSVGKWMLGLAAIVVLILVGVAFLGSNRRTQTASVAFVPSPVLSTRVVAQPTATATSATSTPIPSSTRLPDASVLGLAALRVGPGASFEAIRYLGGGYSLRVIGRTSDGAWIQGVSETGEIGWVDVSQVRLNYSLYTFPLVESPASPTPQSTDTPAPTATARILTCPADPVLLQINNFLEVGLTLELSGPVSARIIVPLGGSTRVCLPTGTYNYDSSATGYLSSSGTKTWVSSAVSGCLHWDWYNSSTVREGTCSDSNADYSPP